MLSELLKATMSSLSSRDIVSLITTTSILLHIRICFLQVLCQEFRRHSPYQHRSRLIQTSRPSKCYQRTPSSPWSKKMGAGCIQRTHRIPTSEVKKLKLTHSPSSITMPSSRASKLTIWNESCAYTEARRKRRCSAPVLTHTHGIVLSANQITSTNRREAVSETRITSDIWQIYSKTGCVARETLSDRTSILRAIWQQALVEHTGTRGCPRWNGLYRQSLAGCTTTLNLCVTVLKPKP